MAEYLEYMLVISSIRFRVAKYFTKVWRGEFLEYLN